MEDMTIVGSKAERIMNSASLTPQQINEQQLVLANNAMSAFYADTFKEDETTWITEVVVDEEQSQDSKQTVQRENPKVGRGLKPTRKGNTQETKQRE
jgi:hypothetical protein